MNNTTPTNIAPYIWFTFRICSYALLVFCLNFLKFPFAITAIAYAFAITYEIWNIKHNARILTFFAKRQKYIVVLLIFNIIAIFCILHLRH